MLVLMWILKILLRVPIHLTQPLRLFPVWLPLCVLCVCSSLIWSAWPRNKIKHKINKKSIKKMQRKSSILGPNIVDFGTHFDISSFPGPNMQHTLILRPANDRLSTQKWSPKWTQNLVKWVSIFSSFFDAVLEPCFQRFCLPNGLKMVPKNVSFLRPPTLLKCSK